MTTRVLVTGVSGFVGSALGAHLRRAGGYHVTGVSRTAPRPGSVDEFLPFDLTSPIPASWPAFDVIVHCAALSSPWGPPPAFRAQNVTATAHLLDFAARADPGRRACRQFVFISSSSVHYRHGDQLGITEDTPLPDVAINAYAATKREAEQLVLDSSLPAVVLRPRAVFGPGDTVLFPRILRAGAKGLLPRITRRDGRTPQGDLIYIDNLSHFIERAIALSARGCFNLTNGEPVDLFAFLENVLTRLDYPRITRTLPVGVAFGAARLLELASAWCLQYREPPITRFGVEVMAYSKTFDVTKATAAFGPAPISTGEGVDRFVAWQKAQ